MEVNNALYGNKQGTVKPQEQTNSAKLALYGSEVKYFTTVVKEFTLTKKFFNLLHAFENRLKINENEFDD